MRQKWLQIAVVLVFVGLLWQSVIVLFHLSDFFLPTPWAIVKGAFQDRMLLLSMAWPTLLEALLGLLAAILFGIGLGAALVLWRPVRYLCLPLVVLSQAIPTLAIAPLFVLWFGLTLNAKVLLVLFALFFPISLSLYEGVKAIPPIWRDQARLMQATRWRRFWFLEFPGALPSLASGIRMATAWAPVSAVASEWVGSSRGLGFLMINASSELNTHLVFEAIGVLMVLAWALYAMVDRILRKIVFWR